MEEKESATAGHGTHPAHPVKKPGPHVIAAATIDSYTTTFAWVAAFFVAGAVISDLILRSGQLQADADAAPAAHM